MHIYDSFFAINNHDKMAILLLNISHKFMFFIRKLLPVSRETLYSEQENFFVWAPVCLGSGIATYFWLPHEPSFLLLSSFVALSVTLIFWWRRSLWPRVGALFILGFILAALRTWSVGINMLDRSLDATVTGRVMKVEDQASGRVRLTIAPDTITPTYTRRKKPNLTNIGHLRVSVRPGDCPKDIHPGNTITVRARFHPFEGAITPHGHNFRRASYYQGMSASGYNLSPATIISSKPESVLKQSHFAKFWSAGCDLIQTWRMSLTRDLNRKFIGQEGAVAAALVTGERSAIDTTTQEAYNRSGLAHILSISGLHFSLVAGMMFFLLRRLFILTPFVALNFPIKKWAAMATIIVALCYMVLSGASIPVVRSCIMIAVVMLAIIYDRNPFSMRLVAFAALVILSVLPESLLSASFQLSFAAVVALIAVFEELRKQRLSLNSQWLQQRPWMLRGPLSYLITISITTLVAGLATAPLTAMIFNRFPLYSLLANVMAIPLAGFLIMPGLVIYLLLLPFGWSGLAVPLVKFGLKALNQTATWVSSLPHAVVEVATGPLICLPMIVFGGLWLCLWKQNWRWFGILPCVIGLIFLAFTPHPSLVFVAPYSLDGTPGVAVCHEGKLWTTINKLDDFRVVLWSHTCGAQTPLSWPRSAIATTGEPYTPLDLGQGNQIIFHKSAEKKNSREFLQYPVKKPRFQYQIILLNDNSTRERLVLPKRFDTSMFKLDLINQRFVAKRSSHRPWD